MAINFMKKYLPQQKGFVILFTILIATIILMIGLGIFSIATRETVLSGTAREAQYAFYAADAGVECALYAESHGMLPAGGGSSFTFDCGSIPVVVGAAQGIYGNPFMFDVLVDGPKKTCAKVTIFDASTDSGAPARRVISQGYNICDTQGKPMTKNPILVERDLDIMYETGTVATPSGLGGPVTITPLPAGFGKPIGGSMTPPPINPINSGIPVTPINASKIPTGTTAQQAPTSGN
jgi:hypothetical protein